MGHNLIYISQSSVLCFLFSNAAKDDFITLVSDHALDVQAFHGYGSNYIKKAGYSPDAYVQMAMQLAVYRLHGQQVGTYEATQVRPFLHGRTETTRTVSPASAAFVKIMGLKPKNDLNDESTRNEKLTLLREAAQSHGKYTRKAGQAKGVDRHLFGMSMLVADKEVPPKLMSDPVYLRAKKWRVSSSHLTHPNFENWGFGEVVPDGVGVGYSVNKDSCVFNITARREHGWTERLSHLLEEALLEMQLLNDLGKQPQSKL
jgi:carnitine O-acetyltransferase